MAVEDKTDRKKFVELGEEKADVVGADLVAWLIENGAELKDVCLRQYAPEVRGVHSLVDFQEGALVLAIPRRCLITVEMGKETETGRKLVEQRIDFVAPKHIFLMMYLLTDMEKDDAFFKHYYRSLPSTLNNMPVFWTDEELGLLKGSYILHQINERRDAMTKDYHTVCRVDPSFARFTLEKFMWARMIVCSRNFGLTIDGVKTAALVPYADMLNHYRPRETSWTFEQKLGCFTISAVRGIQCGNQVYDSYGKKCNHRFLLNYGFAVEDNIEEDGSNPNEVMIHFDFASSEEGMLEGLQRKKQKYFNECGNYSMDARLSCRHTDSSTREGYAFARLLTFTEEEFNSVERTGIFPHAIPPISIDSELRCLEFIRMKMLAQVKNYNSTLEEDNEKLASKSLPLFSNQCQALIFMRGEKQVVHYYLDFIEKMITLLKTPWPQCRDDLKANYAGHDDISCYAQDVVQFLFRKAYSKAPSNGFA